MKNLKRKLYNDFNRKIRGNCLEHIMNNVDRHDHWKIRRELPDKVHNEVVLKVRDHIQREFNGEES